MYLTRTFHNVTYHCHTFEHNRNSYIKLAESHECFTAGESHQAKNVYFCSSLPSFAYVVLWGGSCMLHSSVFMVND